MREKISPSLAAVSPPSSWSVLREQAVSLDNHCPPSGPIACREGRSSRKWIHNGETDSDPPPATQPNAWGLVGTWTSKVHNGRHKGRTSGMQASRSAPVSPSDQFKEHRSRWSEAQRRRALSLYQTAGHCPREGGVLQLRVARNLCDYVSSWRELSPRRPPAQVPLTATKPSNCFELLQCLDSQTC